MLTPITLERYLSFQEYDMTPDPKDPGQEDIAFLLYVAKLIPRTPEQISNVDPSILASYCLAAHQTASAIHSKATLWWRLKELNADSRLATAIVDAGAPATNAEKRAKGEPNFMRASELAAKGEAYVRFLDSMKTNFETGHYWAKGQEIAANAEKKMSGYDPQTPTPGLARALENKLSQAGGVKQGDGGEVGQGNNATQDFTF